MNVEAPKPPSIHPRRTMSAVVVIAAMFLGIDALGLFDPFKDVPLSAFLSAYFLFTGMGVVWDKDRRSAGNWRVDMLGSVIILAFGIGIAFAFKYMGH